MSNLWDQIYEAIDKADCSIGAIGSMTSAAMVVVQPALDAKDAEIDQRDTENTKLREVLNVVADAELRHQHQRNLARRHAERYRTAWASARIGRAQERAQHHETLRTLWETNQAKLEWQGRAVLAEDTITKLREDLREARLGWSRIDIDNTNLIVRNEVAVRKWDALAKQLYAAWWSARIGRAQAREERDQALINEETAKGWRDQALAERDQQRAYLTDLRATTKAIESQRDQLTLTIERIRELHSQHHLEHCNGCGISVTWPCPTLAALDQLEQTTSLAQGTPRVVLWNVCPDCFESHPGGAACHGAYPPVADGESPQVEDSCAANDHDQVPE